MDWAVRKNCPELIEDMWNISDYYIKFASRGNEPLPWALESGCDPGTFQTILEWPDVSTDAKNPRYGARALATAAKMGLTEHLRLLLQAGADVNARDTVHETALFQAESVGQEKVVELLLAAGSLVDFRIGSEGRGQTALLVASKNGHEKVVQLLRTAGAVYHLDEAMRTAAERGHEKVVQVLLNTRNGGFICGLKEASAWGHATVVKHLLDAGARPDIEALWEACRNGQLQAAELLRKAGLDPNRRVGRPGEYCSPLHIARLKGHETIIQMLLAVGAEDIPPPERDFSSFHKAMEDLKKKRAAESGCSVTS
jgi:ankyrin repeat protein